MKKFLISSIISAFLFSMTPAVAQSKLALFPQQELRTDLVNLTVCMMDNLVAIQTAEKIYKEAEKQKENSSGALMVVLALGDAVNAQGSVSHEIVKTLMETYGLPKAEIEKFVSEAIESAKADMQAKLAKIETIEELMQEFQPTVHHCKIVAENFAKKVENTVDGLEKGG